MKCQMCDRIVTQAEADEAAYICDSGTTLCPDCARAMAEHDRQDAGAEMDSGDVAYQ